MRQGSPYSEHGTVDLTTFTIKILKSLNLSLQVKIVKKKNSNYSSQHKIGVLPEGMWPVGMNGN